MCAFETVVNRRANVMCLFSLLPRFYFAYAGLYNLTLGQLEGKHKCGLHARIVLAIVVEPYVAVNITCRLAEVIYL